MGDGFIKLIEMVIALVIFCTVVSGIAGMKKFGRVGGKAPLQTFLDAAPAAREKQIGEQALATISA